jgi:hypothetical protein
MVKALRRGPDVKNAISDGLWLMLLLLLLFHHRNSSSETWRDGPIEADPSVIHNSL